jgi:hypothetical protein
MPDIAGGILEHDMNAALPLVIAQLSDLGALYWKQPQYASLLYKQLIGRALKLWIPKGRGANGMMILCMRLGG